MDQLNDLMAQVAALSGAQRLYRLESEFLGDGVVERWWGRDALGTHALTEVDVLSTDQAVDLEALLGTPAKLLARTADGGEWARSGLVSEARRLGSDGGLVRYRLSLSSWTWWLQHARNSRVFQDKSVRQIVDEVLQAHEELARWQWAEGCDALLGERVRSYCVQYRESDLDFMQRLLAEEGLGWRLLDDAQARCGNGMEIFADSQHLPEAASSTGAGVRFHRSDATESSDSLQQLGRQRQLTSTRVSVLSDDYRRVASLARQLPVEGGGTQSQREHYDPAGAYAFADGATADHYARLQAQVLEAHSRGWNGQGSVRGFQSGTWLRVQQAPFATPPELLLVEVEHTGINNLPTDLRKAVEDNTLGTRPMHGGSAASWQLAEQVGYGNAFKAVERNLPWRPQLHDATGARLNPRPTAPGYQTAIVVAGHAGGGQDVYADSLGRIRVRFHFQDAQGDTTWLRVAQRYAGPGVGSQFLPRVGQEVVVGFLEGDIDRPIVLGALYNGRGEAGVAPTPAGAEGESDRTMYGQANDQRGSAQGNLSGGHAPAWHAAGGGDDAHRHAGALWGIRSREWEGGQGSNHLLFDDSDQQLRVQLASSQQTSQLTLGHLRHQSDNFLGSLRGTGFELRSDGWGAVRATAGSWFTAYAHDGASPAGEAMQPVALLKQVTQLGQRFSDAARTHLTSPLALQEGAGGQKRSRLIADQAPLAALLASTSTTVSGAAFDEARGQARERQAQPGEGRVPHSGDPLLGLAAPAGVLQVAGQALHWTAGEGLLLASGGDSDMTVMGDARLHAAQAIGVLAAAVEGGVKDGNALSVVTGTGELDVQAQNDKVTIQARQALRAASAQGVVELAAGKTIHIATAGGASVTIEGGNITFNCPGTIRVHASRKSFVGPTQGDYPLPLFPKSICVECMLKAAASGAPFAALQ
ncbi:type VI secretion system Vgr family protein [Stenotrophomonas sp. SY1]|uniref:type VI secretion system Vgr family protein n=1 Tax=Stenotrophomonas sp. SY1 TaxID=477235 RepID=UPI001E2EE7BD|nr:type VI secretion system Vgr family protein [Stenotrophomonas sp. SY1]MCD9087066.1 type VI secretion system tip protein VgrG [Stenotrophomonas sp. SY1]